MSDQRVIVAVITTGTRPLRDYRDAPVAIFIDRERRGAASMRNLALQYAFAAHDVDHLFMFDDDCYPTKSGWVDYFLDWHASRGVLFTGTCESFKENITPDPVTSDLRAGGWLGCFGSWTREAWRRVGYYNTEYDCYGFEDAAMHKRLIAAGCADEFARTQGRVPVPMRAQAYIHSEDVYAENPAPNFTHEEKERYIALNRPRYVAECERTAQGAYWMPFSQHAPMIEP